MRCLSAPPLQISHFFPARLGDDFLAESGRRAVFGADGTPTEGGAFVGQAHCSLETLWNDGRDHKRDCPRRGQTRWCDGSRTTRAI